MTGHQLSRTADGLVVKRYGQNAGDRPSREWRALRLLREHAPGLAPEPVAADLDGRPPTVTMTELPGHALGGQTLSEPQLKAIRAALDRLHTSVPSEVAADVPLCPRDAAEGLAGQLAQQRRPTDDAVVARAYDETLRWLAGPEAGRLAVQAPALAVLGRADHNLSNFLWDGRRVGLVDFEYAGRSDVPNEMAELVEHISARCTPDGLWEQFLDGLDLSRAERASLRTARRLRVGMWLLLLLPGQSGAERNPPGALRQQAERVLSLLKA